MSGWRWSKRSKPRKSNRSHDNELHVTINIDDRTALNFAIAQRRTDIQVPRGLEGTFRPSGACRDSSSFPGLNALGYIMPRLRCCATLLKQGRKRKSQQNRLGRNHEGYSLRFLLWGLVRRIRGYDLESIAPSLSKELLDGCAMHGMRPAPGCAGMEQRPPLWLLAFASDATAYRYQKKLAVGGKGSGYRSNRHRTAHSPSPATGGEPAGIPGTRTSAANRRAS